MPYFVFFALGVVVGIISATHSEPREPIIQPVLTCPSVEPSEELDPLPEPEYSPRGRTFG